MTTLTADAWRSREGLSTLLIALQAKDDVTRFVGGFVRDTLLDIPTNDVDCATRLLPNEVMERVSAMGFKAVPTGLAHGTVTVILPSGPVEVTTLRRDISTDGRRATVAYTDDWQEDAARRDFTINALSANPETGVVHDYFGGLGDLKAGRVRFIGDPITRIAEDHLRILRFFRFFARFGRDAPDPAALAACVWRANDLMALSRERIADELLKLLGLPDPLHAVDLMTTHQVLRPILPEILPDAAERLGSLVAAEKLARVSPAAIRRLAALLPADTEVLSSIGARLKLSNSLRKRLAAMAGSADPETAHELAYRFGTDTAVDRLLLGGYTETASEIEQWVIPRLPISGGSLVARGLATGPAVATTLQRIEARWIAEGFPDEARVRAIADQIMRQI